MQVISKCVLLLKAADSDTKYADKLETHGFTSKTLRTLEFKFSRLEELSSRLRASKAYSGLIFTTPRAVAAVRKSLDLHHDRQVLRPEWLAKTNYAIGQATGDTALNILGLRCSGLESGNSANLVDIILKDIRSSPEQFKKPRFLFPSGNLRSDELIDRLRAESVKVDTLTVYETVFSTDLDRDFDELTNRCSSVPEVFVFFSPSGIRGMLKHVECVRQHKVPIKFVAIGPTTADALKKHNLSVDAVCEAPNPDSLVAALNTMFETCV